MLLTFHSKPGNSVAALTGLHMKSLVIRGLLIMLLLTMQKISAQDSLIIKGTITKSFNGRKLKLSVIYSHRTSIINPEVNKLSTIKNGRFSFAIRANTLENYTIDLVGTGESVSQTFAGFLGIVVYSL